jgi:hypothetical protein
VRQYFPYIARCLVERDQRLGVAKGWLPRKRFAPYTISRCRVASSSYRYRTDSMHITSAMLIVPGGVILPAGFHDIFSFFEECADCLGNEALREDGIVRLERLNDALVLLKAPDPLLIFSPRTLNTHYYEGE